MSNAFVSLTVMMLLLLPFTFINTRQIQVRRRQKLKKIYKKILKSLMNFVQILSSN